MEFIRKYQFLVGAGVALPFYVLAGPSGIYALQPVPYAGAAVYLIAAVLVLAFVCRPLTRYASCMAAAGGFCVASALCGAVRRVFPGSDFAQFPLGLMLVGLPLLGAAIWIALSGVLCVATYLRRRNWPVYSAGCCKKCGYDLRMLDAPRCPECGTPFTQKAGDQPA